MAQNATARLGRKDSGAGRSYKYRRTCSTGFESVWFGNRTYTQTIAASGSSAPTSGSEHLISHALDKILEVPQLHGIQVGIATYIMAKVQDHRYIRVSTVLQDTGFWDYVETLHMKKPDFLKAIDMAPTIKPHRHTYLHEEKYREAAKKLVLEDEILNRVLED